MTYIKSEYGYKCKNLSLFPIIVFMGIQVFHHCFMSIFYPIDEIHKTIIHLMKYHYQVHAFIDSSQTDGSNVWCNSLKKKYYMVIQFDAYTFVTLNNDFDHYFMQAS